MLLLLSFGLFAQGIDNFMLDAVALYQEQQYKAARDQLQTLSQAAPGNDAVWYYLSMCEAQLGEMSPAIAHMAKAASIDPGNYWYRQRLAVLFAAIGNVAKQIELMEGLRKDFPEKAYSISYDLVNLYIQAERFDDALASLNEVEKISGEDEQTVRVRYDILRNQGKDDDAARILQEFCSQQPSVLLVTLLGDLHMDYDRYDEAMECYEKALELEEDYVPALLGRSEVFRQTKRFDEYFASMEDYMSSKEVPVYAKTMYITNAMRSLEPRVIGQNQAGFDSMVNKALETHPTDSTMLQTAGLYYFSTGDEDRAKEIMRLNADTYPESVRLEAVYQELLQHTQDWPELRTRAEGAFKRFGMWEFLDYAAGAAYAQQDWQGVIDYCTTKIDNAGRDTLARVTGWSAIGDMYYQMGKTAKAFKAYSRALKLDPDYVPALNNYAYYSAINGRCLKKAEEMAAHAVELAPTEPTYLDTYGWILHLRRKDAQARPIYQKVMGYGGKDQPVLLDHYAEVLFSLGEYALAREYWRQAILKNSGEIPDLEERVAKREKQMSASK